MNTQFVSEIKGWIYEAAEAIRKNLKQELTIQEKSSRTDLVTNMDEQTQEFLMNKIQTHYPTDQILGEEKGFTKVASFAGRVWIIDPIDGTLNFVLEKENFCIMLAVYEDGIGQLGFIYDVMKDEMYWGGKGAGVFVNDQRMAPPSKHQLSAGLFGMNAYMYGENLYHAREIGRASMGIRVSGCAGLELIAMLKGNHVGYLSKLNPWDYAAGLVLLEEFGFKYATACGKPLAFSGQEYFLAASPAAYDEIMDTYIQESENH